MTKENYPKVYLYRRIVQAKLFMDKKYAEKIDLDNISDEAFFSKFHFIRMFKSLYGKTPHQYLKSVRIEKAKELLKSGMSVSESCYAVGFDSLSSFSSLFSKTFNITPSGYFRQQKKEKEEILKKPMHFIPACYAYQHGWNKNSNFEEVQN